MKKIVFAGILLVLGLSGLAALHIFKERPIPPAGIYKSTQNPESNAREIVFLSDIYNVDQIYTSMKGPSTTKEISLMDTEKPELVWITGYSAVMVEPDGETPVPQEYMCHSNLDFDSKMHLFLFQSKNAISDRLFTLSQGQYEIHFPEGFGIPVLSPETLSLTTQVLNLNDENADIDTRHRITISYVKDSELKAPMKPLMQVGANALKRLDEDGEGYFNIEEPDEAAQGSGCLVGDMASDHTKRDKFNRLFTGHWVVKPGREVNHTLITELINLQYDTTIHYIAVHLHPFAESLELKDLTTGETIYKSNARNFKDKIGLDYVDYMSSPEGIPIYKDHEYQLISTYNNNTDKDQDSMAVFYLYVLDRTYKKPNESIAQILTIKPGASKPAADM